MEASMIAEILVDSLSYIKKFHNKLVVIKYGGHAMQTQDMREQVIKDIVLLKYIGMKPIIVHGGGPEINKLLELKNIESSFVDGKRVTTPEIMEAAEMILTGSVSPNLASYLNANGVASVSVSGKDSQMLQANIESEDLGLVGDIYKVNTDYINYLLEGGYVPVISPIAYGPDGMSLNVNSDTAASKIAGALNAEKLILLTDVDGVMQDPSKPESLISHLTIEQIYQAIDEGVITGGMIPKLLCCVDALEEGVDRCHILNGLRDHALVLEMFTNDGIGTMVTRN